MDSIEMLKIKAKNSKSISFLAVKYKAGLIVVVDSYIYRGILERNNNNFKETIKEIKENFDVVVDYREAKTKKDKDVIYKMVGWHKGRGKYNAKRRKFKSYETNCRACSKEIEIKHQSQLLLCSKCKGLHILAKQAFYTKSGNIRTKVLNKLLKNKAEKKEKRWTTQEIVYLLQNKGKKSNAQVAEDLGRSLIAVQQKQYRLFKTKRYLDYAKYLKGDENEK